MKTVAHFIDKYIQLSETFIYNQITHIKGYHSIVLTKNIINRDIFPFEPIFIFRKRDIDRVLMENNVGLIHAHFGWSGISALPIALKYNLPLITTFYGIDATRMLRYFSYRRNIKKLFNISKLILVMSQDMKQDLIKAGCDERKIKMHYIGVEITEGNIRRDETDDAVQILMCGRFVEKKGFEYGIRAYEGVRGEGGQGDRGTGGTGEREIGGQGDKGRGGRDVRLVIVGDGRLRRRIESLVQSPGIEPYVSLTGFLTAKKVREKMVESDIFLAPHITARNGDKEGMPTTVKEAMAVGLPVVSTYHAGIPEVVEDKKSGFLVKERDVDGLSSCLDRLIDNSLLREKMGERGREIIKERFTLDKKIRELEEIYARLM